MKLCDRCRAVVGELHIVNLNAGFDDKNYRWIIIDREFCLRCKEKLTHTVREAQLEAELMIHRRFLECRQNEKLEQLRWCLRPYPIVKMIENIPTPLVSFAGSGVAGFFMGMFLRRVLKFLVIIIGSFIGAVFLVIQ
jgi:hypothetical protein